MAKKKTTRSSPSITDAEQCLVWLDPTIAAAIDAIRGDKTRPRQILELLGKALKLKGYAPRGRGRPVKSTPGETHA